MDQRAASSDSHIRKITLVRLKRICTSGYVNMQAISPRFERDGHDFDVSLSRHRNAICIRATRRIRPFAAR